MTNHVRVVFVTNMLFPSIGGAQVRAQKQARRLRELGHNVTLVTLRLYKYWNRNDVLDGVPVVRIGGFYAANGELRAGRLRHFLVDVRLIFTLWKLRQSYDVIHVFQLSSLAGAAAFVAKLLHKPILISIACEGPRETQITQFEKHTTLMADTLKDTSFLTLNAQKIVMGELDYLPRVILGGKVILDFLRRSDAYYQVLSTRCRTYLATYGFRAEQIIHIPGSVDTGRFLPGLQSSANRAERAILCVARLEYSKGVDVLLHAWGRMLAAPAEWRTHLKPRLCIVGDGMLKAQLLRIAEDLGLTESVDFLGERTDVKNLLQQSWGFVLPSRWEGMSNALLEALACGLPSVATRVSGSEDIITDGVNGLLVEPEQPIELGQGLRRIIEDADLAQRLGKAGRATTIQHYQLDTVVEQCLTEYRRLLGEQKQTRHTYGEPLQVREK